MFFDVRERAVRVTGRVVVGDNPIHKRLPHDIHGGVYEDVQGGVLSTNGMGCVEGNRFPAKETRIEDQRQCTATRLRRRATLATLATRLAALAALSPDATRTSFFSESASRQCRSGGDGCSTVGEGEQTAGKTFSHRTLQSGMQRA